MEKVLLLGKGDSWYCRHNSGQFSYSLLINGKSIPDVHCSDLVVDRAGNPHLVVNDRAKLGYYYWGGQSWLKGRLPAFMQKAPAAADGFRLAVTADNRVHLLYINAGSKGHNLIHCLIPAENGATPAGVPFGESRLEEVIPWGKQELLVLYSRAGSRGSCLGILHYQAGKWKDLQEIALRGGRYLNWGIEEDRLLLLAGVQRPAEAVLRLYSFPHGNPAAIPGEISGSVHGWDGRPGFIRGKNKSLCLCWCYAGRIQHMQVDNSGAGFKDFGESEVFYPAQALVPSDTNNLGDLLAFTMIHGVRLEFPLILPYGHLERMVNNRLKNRSK